MAGSVPRCCCASNSDNGMAAICRATSRRLMCVLIGSITDGLGMALGEIVRLISVTAENTWPHSKLRHWNMVSRLVLVNCKLVRVYACSLQCGHIIRMGHVPFEAS